MTKTWTDEWMSEIQTEPSEHWDTHSLISFNRWWLDTHITTETVAFTSLHTLKSPSSRVSPSGAPAKQWASVRHQSPNGLFGCSSWAPGWRPLQNTTETPITIHTSLWKPDSFKSGDLGWSSEYWRPGRWLIIDKEKETHQQLLSCPRGWGDGRMYVGYRHQQTGSTDPWEWAPEELLPGSAERQHGPQNMSAAGGRQAPCLISNETKACLRTSPEDVEEAHQILFVK